MIKHPLLGIEGNEFLVNWLRPCGPNLFKTWMPTQFIQRDISKRGHFKPLPGNEAYRIFTWIIFTKVQVFFSMKIPFVRGLFFLGVDWSSYLVTCLTSN